MLRVGTFSLFVFLCSVAVKAEIGEDVQAKFADFVLEYNRTYAVDPRSVEYGYRLGIFAKNLDRIAAEQALSPTSVHGINKFADHNKDEVDEFLYGLNWSPEDIDRVCLGKNVPPAELAALRNVSIPDSFDWRDHKPAVVTKVRDQHKPVYCGSCWAFSAIGNIEGQYALAGDRAAVELSQQSIIDCSKGCCTHDGSRVCNNGCKGGWQFVAYDDMKTLGGVPSYADYPYTARDGQCKSKSFTPVAKITDYACVTKDDSPEGADEQTMAEYLVKNGPLAIAMDVSSMMSYSGGVFNPSRCSQTNLGHALLIVGYGTDNGSPYWTIKNSWGDTWGERGYVRLYRGKKKCGITMAVSSAKVAK